MKRDAHFGMIGDSVPVGSEKEMNDCIRAFKRKGTLSVVVQKFVQGPCVKFYGIGKRVIIPDSNVEGATKSIAGKICEIARHASSCLGVPVFGGDIILNSASPFLVDFNEWPSFSAVRDQAATEISKLLVGALHA